jgi:hypothetical protein
MKRQLISISIKILNIKCHLRQVFLAKQTVHLLTHNLSSAFSIHLDHISLIHIIEGPQSAEDEENTIHSSIRDHQKDTSTPHFSPINTYRQQSTSATSNSDDSPVFPQTKKHSSRSMTNKKRMFYNQETSTQADQLTLILRIRRPFSERMFSHRYKEQKNPVDCQ